MGWRNGVRTRGRKEVRGAGKQTDRQREKGEWRAKTLTPVCKLSIDINKISLFSSVS